MWKWISEQYDDNISVESLKARWLATNRFTKSIYANCFFCEYAGQDEFERFLCDERCPGKMVSTRFGCQNVTYHYQSNPKRFYRKLLKLDKKRRQK